MAAVGDASKVLVFGGAEVGKKAVVSALKKLSGSTDTQSSAITVSTKYFDAQLELEVTDSAVFEAGPHADSSAAAQAIDACEGLIIVSNGSHGAARIQEQLAEWAAPLKAANAELKLLVATHADRLDDAQRDALHGALVLWALDHGFEFVQADATNPVEGGSDREKEGLPRVWEAMQSVMWSSMQMHPPGGAASGVGTAPAAGAAATAAASADSAVHSDAAADSTASKEAGGETLATETQSRAAHETAAPEFEEFEDGPGSDEFEAMLAQVAAVRAANQKEGVTDEQRKQNAADMALKLLSAFGLGESEEDLKGVLGGEQ